MKNRNGTGLYLIMVSFFFIISCAVRTPVQNTVPVNIEKLKSINVVLRDFKVSSGIANGEMSMVQCKFSAKGYLQTKDLFGKVEESMPQTDVGNMLLVDATLVDLRIVSGAARFWAGAMAGRSHMKVIVKISDQEGNMISQDELFGAPNAMGSAWSFGGSDRDLPTAMGCLIGDYVIAESAKLE
jgi:hypothetical protein